MQEEHLIYDWNAAGSEQVFPSRVEVCDETLRDGIQSPSVHDPAIDEKLELISLMDKIGITVADIGLPGAGPRAYADALTIAQYIRDQRLQLRVSCAARTLIADIAPIANIQQKAGIPITVYCFLGTSPIRQMVELWDLEKLRKIAEDAFSFANLENLAFAFVTEDTIRSHPNTLRALFGDAIAQGAERLVLCDTVGHATPNGIKALVNFTKDIIAASQSDAKIDWHGHNDRGLGVSNALSAAEYGCHRIHGTALGIGERIGNTAIDQLIVNLKLLHAYPHDVEALQHYVEKAAAVCQVPLPYNYPIFGADAFRTATGVHAAAVIKAQSIGNNTLADTIYSGVPAHWFGKSQQIEIGPMSGASNVRYWLKVHKIDARDDVILAILNHAKQQSRVLTADEILSFIRTLNSTSNA